MNAAEYHTEKCATGARLNTVAHDGRLMDKVLRPYKSHCRYLKKSDLDLVDGKLTSLNEFSIPESCYIDDTGHFNSVEFNICYNQMMYYTIAKSVNEQLAPEFSKWTMSDFWQKQLPDILITRFASKFRRAIDSNDFKAIFSIERSLVSRKSSPTLFLKTRCEFWDGGSGHAEGEIDLAIVNTLV